MCGKRVLKVKEVLSAKSWKYFFISPSKTVKNPMWLCSKGTKWATCSVPMESDALCPLSPTRAPATSFTAKDCTRDLKDIYVSKVPCEVLPVKPAARAHSLMS